MNPTTEVILIVVGTLVWCFFGGFAWEGLVWVVCKIWEKIKP
jgi:hypothetical protein